MTFTQKVAALVAAFVGGLAGSLLAHYMMVR